MEYSQSICAVNLLMLNKILNKLVKNKLKYIHVDIMDGHFVKNFGINFETAKYLIEKFPKVNFDAHLMVNNPLKHLNRLIEIGFKTIFLPIEKISRFNFFKILKKHPNIFFGIMIKSNDDINDYKEIIKKTKVILLMTINKIGGTGEKLNPDLFSKVYDIKKINPNIKIYSDGGLRKENAYLFKKHLIDVSVGGSIIFTFENIKKFFDWWNNEINNT
ncbi:beta/alpha barrel domain-containing protein [Mesomycoplasma neurolyticum]|uniref:D-ribulose-5-phosphate 3 epimerase n=1 Tax=Mesomycoplasma neurolyticum TaxID=2120 RepID=A0A449A539_9BACT|nr:ribulose phosphate epimerase [Mesomycoplasma neurolyticum]VEU59349.1 d-ribulose-5-phosphate 3 epimerase [Mesomycoplasma neurolyticum]